MEMKLISIEEASREQLNWLLAKYLVADPAARPIDSAATMWDLVTSQKVDVKWSDYIGVWTRHSRRTVIPALGIRETHSSASNAEEAVARIIARMAFGNKTEVPKDLK